VSSPRAFERYCAIGLTVAAVTWPAAVLFIALEPARLPIATVLVQTAGAIVCHQRPERSFHVEQQPLAVCARCTGLYLSGALGALLGWAGGARLPRRSRRMLALAAMPTAASLAVEWLGMNGLSNLVRALAALSLGGATAWLFVRMLRSEARAGTYVMIA